MELLNYQEYFETLATNLPEVAHEPEGKHRFAMMELHEILSSIQNDLYFSDQFTLVLEYFDSTMRGSNQSQLKDHQNAALMVLQAVEEGNYQSKRSVQHQARVLGKKIIDQMIEDQEEGLLDGLEPTFALQFTGPWFDNCYGARLTFSFVAPFSSEL